MFADGLAVDADDRARLRRQVAAEEVAEFTFADKADTGGVFLLGGDQLQLFGDAAHLRLLQLPDREQALRHLLVAQGIEEVALIFVAVDAAQQAALAVHVLATHVVAGGDKIGPQIFGGKLQEGFEFDLFIAQDVRVRRAAGLVLFQEQLKHVVPVFRREVHRVQFDAQLVADRLRVGQIGRGGAVLFVVVFFPVFHEQPSDLIALLL